MRRATRRYVLRYGIVIDLVILATGAGMLLPPTPAVPLSLFGAAVLLSTWKGGWPGGLVALLLSVLLLAMRMQLEQQWAAERETLAKEAALMAHTSPDVLAETELRDTPRVPRARAEIRDPQ